MMVFTEISRATAQVALSRLPPNFRILTYLAQSLIDDVFDDSLEILHLENARPQLRY